MVFCLYFLLWIIFNGRITVEICVIGLVVSLAVYWFTCHFMGFSIQKEILLLKKLPVILRLLCLIFVEVVKSNIMVIYWVYQNKKKRKPVMVLFDVDLKTEPAQVILADCITITPGTMTGLQEENHYMVHCLDESMSNGLDVSIFVDILKELEALTKEEASHV